MADIPVPSIATATPAAADTVVGVQGGAVKRFAVSNLAKVGSFTQAGTGAAARTVESKLQDVVSVKDFGAVCDGVTDDTAAIVAALAAHDDVTLPPSSIKITSTISVGQRKRLIGAGYATNIVADVIGPAISITSGNGPTEVGGFRVSGSATSGVSVNNAQLLYLHDISLDGLTATNGFVFVSTWGGQFKNLYTNGATISDACFICGANFNANQCSNWYTSNRCTYNLLLDATYDSGGGVAHGSHFSMMTLQSGDYGLYVRAFQTAVFDCVYTEDTVFPLRLGDKAGGALARAITINGIDLDAPMASHPQYANREAGIWFDYAIGCSIHGADFTGALNLTTIAPITFSGGTGSGALAIARVTPAGVVHSVEVLCPGSYTVAPTATIGGSGSGATVSVGLSGTDVTLTLTAGGSGYTPANRYPVAITYHTAYKCSVSSPMFNGGLGDRTPLYPWLVRRSGANTGAGVTLLDDQTFRTSSDGASCEVRKTHGYGYTHSVISYSNTGVPQAYVYTPPLYP